jgi:hypothetical protein
MNVLSEQNEKKKKQKLNFLCLLIGLVIFDFLFINGENEGRKKSNAKCKEFFN